ncbi:MAG: putative toxin-antitoxin system toxin component, PIN family [Syntrophaceae bacterium]|nr:putative toxin-antitoxin system toxin component, PIN family [Syntrophaceae bacterium]
MRIILDTNVFISGIFFTGPPYQIVKAWRDGSVQLLVSPSILDEHQRIGAELALQFRDVDLKPFLDLLTIQAEIVLAPTLPAVIPDDPSDDKFLEAAVAGNASYIISGDKHLLKLSEFQGIQILKPKDFVQRYLASKGNK